jgi:hypothetical protein
MNFGTTTAAGLSSGPAFGGAAAANAAATTVIPPYLRPPTLGKGFSLNPKLQQDKILATTTTKAFEVKIIVPKIHRCYVPIEEDEKKNKKKEEREEETNSLELSDRSTAATATTNATPSLVTTGSVGTPAPQQDNTVFSSTAAHRGHRRAQTFGGIANPAPPRMFMVYDDLSTKDHPLLSKQAAVSMARQQFGEAVTVTGAHIIEGVHETEGVVVQLEPKNKAPSSQDLQGMDESVRSNRSRKISYADRNEVMSLMSGDGEEKKLTDDGTITPPASISDPLDQQFQQQQQQQQFRIEDDHEIIGYVKGEETPKTTGRGHRKTASNVPVVKDIVTAEEMAAIVKIPAEVPPPKPLQQHLPPASMTQLSSSHPTILDMDFSTLNSMDNNNNSNHFVPKRDVHKGMKIQSKLSEQSLHDEEFTNALNVFGTTTTTTTPQPKAKRAHCTELDDDGRPKRRVSYMTEAAAADAIRRSLMSSKDLSRHSMSDSPTRIKPLSSMASPDWNASENGDNAVADAVPEMPNTPSGTPPPNTEIKVSVLVELALKQVREDGLLLNRPVSIEVTSNESEWVQFTTLTMDPTIGIILERLERIGVGSVVGSVSIHKVELCRTADLYSDLVEQAENASKDAAAADPSIRIANGNTPMAGSENANIAAARTEWKNATSRLRVEQVKEQIHEQASFSFDYVALLVVASSLAGIGE